MTKYFAVPVLFTFIFMCSSCQEAFVFLVDDDTVCGENVNTGYQTVSNKAFQMTAALNPQSRLVFVNEQDVKMVLPLVNIREQKGHLYYKILCNNYAYNVTQYEYCEAQMLDYIFCDTVNNAEIRYSWYVDHSNEMIFDMFSTSLRVDNYLGGSDRFVADSRGQRLPANLTNPNEWERTVGDTTMLGRPFQDVTYHNWGMNKGKGYFFQKGVGIVAMWSENQAFWVLDAME